MGAQPHHAVVARVHHPHIRAVKRHCHRLVKHAVVVNKLFAPQLFLRQRFPLPAVRQKARDAVVPLARYPYLPAIVCDRGRIKPDFHIKDYPLVVRINLVHLILFGRNGAVHAHPKVIAVKAHRLGALLQLQLDVGIVRLVPVQHSHFRGVLRRRDDLPRGNRVHCERHECQARARLELRVVGYPHAHPQIAVLGEYIGRHALRNPQHRGEQPVVKINPLRFAPYGCVGVNLVVYAEMQRQLGCGNGNAVVVQQHALIGEREPGRFNLRGLRRHLRGRRGLRHKRDRYRVAAERRAACRRNRYRNREYHHKRNSVHHQSPRLSCILSCVCLVY